jgi:hypothetical protein
LKLAGLSDIQSFDFWGVMAAIITAAISIVAAAISLIQTLFTKRQVDSTVRAWVGGTEPALMVDSRERRFVYHITNTGSIPAEDVQLIMITNPNLLTREDLKEKGKFEEGSSVKIVLFPGSKFNYQQTIDDSMYEHIKKNEFAYVGVRIRYRYGKRGHAEYWAILKYVTRLNTSATRDEWIE